MQRLGFYLIYLLNTQEHHFNVSGFNFFQIFSQVYERGRENHLNRCRSRESNPSLLRGKQVRYQLHHCLSGQRVLKFQFGVFIVFVKGSHHLSLPRQCSKRIQPAYIKPNDCYHLHWPKRIICWLEDHDSHKRLHYLETEIVIWCVHAMKMQESMVKIS